jgi:hypothetical protein
MGAIKEHNHDEIEKGLRKNNIDEFEALSRPLIKYLCENHHPHVTIIITPTDAQLLYGQMSTGTINDYILD